MIADERSELVFMVTDRYESRRSVINQTKRIIFRSLGGKRANVYLFGSWARMEERRSSDIDVALEFESADESNRRIVNSVRHALEESTLPYRVDVVYLNEADEHIVKKVKGEGILWDAPENG
jgi:hypothetical protein